MSATPSSSASSPLAYPKAMFERHIKPLLTPYYMTVASVLGGMTVAFTAVIVLLIIVAENFNVLGWTE